jgi:hypothetical protein
MPPAFARERLIVLAQSSVQSAADYARMQDNPSESRRHLKPRAFVENLIDMRTGALFAPVSEAAQAAMRR